MIAVKKFTMTLEKTLINVENKQLINKEMLRSNFDRHMFEALTECLSAFLSPSHVIFYFFFI